MRIVDCFPYFNERELLELRIKLLYDHVDEFIITDADHTHSGVEKPYTCVDVLKELAVPIDKFTVIHAHLPSVNETDNNFIRERLQRDIPAQYFQDDTMYIVSDCDEIIDPNFLEFYSTACQKFPNNIIRLPMVYLNCRADLRVYDTNNIPRTWYTPFVCMRHHVQKYSLSEIREAYATGVDNLEYKDIFLLDENKSPIEVGWHFSWMGSNSNRKNKLKSFLHSNDPDNYIFAGTPYKIGTKEMDEYFDQYKPAEGSLDPYGRTDHILKKYPTENLPQIIFELENVKSFLFQ